MSDISFPRCETCGEPEYACHCQEGNCLSCGGPLDDEEVSLTWEECFECWFGRHD
jgi:hypothetical protein